MLAAVFVYAYKAKTVFVPNMPEWDQIGWPAIVLAH